LQQAAGYAQSFSDQLDQGRFGVHWAEGYGYCYNFLNRTWKTILTRLEIDYRKSCKPELTLISHVLDLGKSSLEVAQLTGRDVRVLYKHYGRNVSSRPRLPELSTGKQNDRNTNELELLSVTNSGEN
jgi:hypothetical protein